MSTSRSVLQGAITISIVSALGTGFHGIVTARPNTALLAFSAGINGGISAATFFSIREFAVSPLLVATLPGAQYERRRKDKAETELDWSEIRTDRLLDSAVSGFFTGGIIRGLTRNLRGAMPGAVSAGLVCTLLQYMYNESKITRLKYLVHRSQKPPSVVVTSVASPDPSSPVTDGQQTKP